MLMDKQRPILTSKFMCTHRSSNNYTIANTLKKLSAHKQSPQNMCTILVLFLISQKGIPHPKYLNNDNST